MLFHFHRALMKDHDELHLHHLKHQYRQKENLVFLILQLVAKKRIKCLIK
jgi:hypothetical protein